MIFNSPPRRSSSTKRRAGLVLVSMMLGVTSTQAQVQNVTVGPQVGGVCPANVDFSYSAPPNVPLDNNNAPPVMVSGAAGAVEWSFDSSSGVCGGVVGKTITCAGSLMFTLPNNPNETVAADQPVTLTGSPTDADLDKVGYVTLKVTDTSGNCGTRKYRLRVATNATGWGDPHMTTVDGVKYDFQSAGEFTALKEENFEIQTRQRAVPTTTVPGPNAYTGLGVCVAIYSAVAVKIGSNRVTLQPNPNVQPQPSASGQPDPSGLELRVNGTVTTLGESGIDLRVGGVPTGELEGRVSRAAGGSYEFDDVNGTQLVATPTYWNSQQTWYLNLNVYQTSAAKGIWGRLGGDSWLPALPDGTSMGSKPEALDQRYQDLYVKFANAWRVTDATSLFDYAPGTNTATFTIADWPRFNVKDCLLQGQTPAEPTTQAIAAQACNAVTGAAQADCIFDVMATGNTGFAQTYVAMQQFKPKGTGWQPVLAGAGLPPTPTQPPSKWPWWVWVLIVILVLIIIAALLAKKKATP